MYKDEIVRTAGARPYGDYLKGSVEQAFLKHMGDYQGDKRAEGIKKFLEDNGFKVISYINKSGHSEATTSDGYTLSSNGVVMKENPRF